MSCFIEVELMSWSCDKVKVGIYPGEKTASVLYDNKKPILKLCSNDPINKYVVSSYKGLERNKVWDSASKKFLDEWAGDWSINMMVATSYQAAEENPYTKKIMEIHDDIHQKVEKAYRTKVKHPLGYVFIKEKTDLGEEIDSDQIDKSKGIYLKTKVGYQAPPSADKIKVNGKDVPALDARTPKGLFVDVSRAQSDMTVKNPDIECQVGMSLIPKYLIGLYKIGNVVHITKKLLQCYYQPKDMGGNSVDETLVAMLRNNCTLTDDGSTDY